MAQADLGDHASQICHTFGLGRLLAPPEPAARGQQGVVWRFETDHGRYAVKQLVSRTTPAAARLDADFCEVIARRAGLTVPRPVRAGDGEVLVEIGRHQVRVQEWLDLTPIRTPPEPEPMGSLLATLHREPQRTSDPVDPWYWQGVAAEEWRRLADRLAAAAAPFADEFAEFARGQLDLQRWLVEPRSGLQLCHRDLWLDNLMTTADGRICVIDWDNCGAADPGQELAMALFEQCYSDPGRATRLTAAYRDQGGTGRLAGPESFTMVIAQLGHFATTAARRWLEAGDAAERQRMESWFREGDDQPLTPALVEALLAAGQAAGR
jgi:Ser/Thr protein kinase RdoA (MazF antagonist)